MLASVFIARQGSDRPFLPRRLHLRVELRLPRCVHVKVCCDFIFSGRQSTHTVVRYTLAGPAVYSHRKRVNRGVLSSFASFRLPFTVPASLFLHEMGSNVLFPSPTSFSRVEVCFSLANEVVAFHSTAIRQDKKCSRRHIRLPYLSSPTKTAPYPSILFSSVFSVGSRARKHIFCYPVHPQVDKDCQHVPGLPS